MISYKFTGAVMNRLRDKQPCDLSTTERMVLIVLCSFANEKGTCYPSHREIARVSGGAVSTVKRALKKLEDKQYVTVQQQRKEEGDLTSNLYTINQEKIPPILKVFQEAGQTMEEKMDDRTWAE